MKHIALILSALILTACGGGGGRGSAQPVASTSTFQVKQAYANDFYAVGPYSFNLSGTVVSGGETGTVYGNGSVVQTPVSNTIFEGVAALQKTKTVTGTMNVSASGGTSTAALPTTSSTTFISPAYNLLGFSAAGAYSVASPPTDIPATARVGDFGPVGTIYTYASSVGGATLATTVITWALTADTASTAILLLTQTARNSSNLVTGTQEDAFRLTPAGGVTRLSGTAVLTGLGTLTFTYQ